MTLIIIRRKNEYVESFRIHQGVLHNPRNDRRTTKNSFHISEGGYGFIEQESGGDIFVHHSEVQGETLNEGELVEFEIGEGRKGPCAVNVKSASTGS